MPSNLPDGCTQADIDSYYGWDYEECPECCAELEVDGDYHEGSKTCTNEECGYSDSWDNIPDFD
jgi:hypothetical protein